jgi:lipoprotein-anchoring transpeptidase ErfK/SrfK
MRKTALVLLLGCLFGVAAGAAVPATAIADTRDTVTPALSLTASQPLVDYAAKVTLTGALSVPGRPAPPPVTVRVSGRAPADAGWTELGTATTGADGGFTFVHHPERTIVYRVEYPGDAGLGMAAARPAEVTLQVRSGVKLTVPAICWLKEQAVIGGAVLPARPAGSLVTIESLANGAWVTWATAALDDQSRFSVTWTPLSKGRPQFRAFVPADVSNAAACSQVARTAARDPNPHHVPSRLSRCIVIDHTEFRLYYYEAGHIVRDFPCVLGKRSTPTPYGNFRIQGKRAHPGGPNGAYYMSYSGIIGIHGTNQPQLLRRFPRAFSHGCTRLYNRDITWLYARCPIGTTVWSVK